MVKDVKPVNTGMTDEQQSMQALKKHGGNIVLVILLALAGYFGWDYWQKNGGRIDTEAANSFAKIQTTQNSIDQLSNQNNLNAEQTKQLETAVTTLQKEVAGFATVHPDTIYTYQALMLQAKQQSDNNDFKSAVETLKKVTAIKLDDAGLETLATLRYAQALVANGQADEAKKILDVPLHEAFIASQQELLGDIAMSKNDKKTAIEHYQKAWQAIEKRNETQTGSPEDRALLRMKMESLGLTPTQPTDGGLIVENAKPAVQVIQNEAEMPTSNSDKTDVATEQDSKNN